MELGEEMRLTGTKELVTEEGLIRGREAIVRRDL
jgi:hypothetical protein